MGLPSPCHHTDAVTRGTAWCDTVRLACGATGAALAAVRGASVTFTAASGGPVERLVGLTVPLSRGLVGYVALTGHVLQVDPAPADPRFDDDTADRIDYSPRVMTVVPVRGDGQGVIGVLAVFDHSTALIDPVSTVEWFAARTNLLDLDPTACRASTPDERCDRR